MASFFTPEQLASFSANEVRCDFLVKFDFASGPKYAWNGNQPLLALDGNTYLPMYGYGNIDGLSLSGGEQSETITLSLNGLPDQALDYLSEAVGSGVDVEQRMLTVYLQLFTSEWQPEGMPIPISYGFMQPPRVSRAPGTPYDAGGQSVTIVAENVFFSRSRPRYGRYTDRDQQGRYPGDKFFGFVSSLLFKRIRYPDY